MLRQTVGDERGATRAFGGNLSQRWLIAEVVLWMVCLGILVWSEPLGSAFEVLFALFCVHRLAGALALFKVSDIHFDNPNRIQVIAGWLYFRHTLAYGVLFTLAGVTAIVTHPDGLGIVLGVLALFVGSPFLIAGIQLSHGWREAVAKSARR
jgi:hypothetical protein